MTKSNDVPFTYHERLRYSYLLKILPALMDSRLRNSIIYKESWMPMKLNVPTRGIKVKELTIKKHGANLMIIVQIIIRSLIMRMPTS